MIAKNSKNNSPMTNEKQRKTAKGIDSGKGKMIP